MRGRKRSLVALVLGASMVPILAPMTGHAAFKGDNGRIFFYREFGEGSFEIYSMKKDGTGKTRLTNDEIDDLDPFASPDGRWVVWERDLDDGQLDVFKMRVDGTGRKNLTHNGENGIDDEDPSWSPNGRKIVFTSDRDAQEQLWIMKADGSDPVQLTTDEGTEEDNPAWSPNGKWIAFMRDFGEGPNQICRIRPDGTDEECLTGEAFSNADDPDWSPNSNKIVFEGLEALDKGNENVYVMKANGDDPQQLTNRSDDASDPAYFPSGTKIIFETNIDEPNDLFQMNADGSNEQRVTSNFDIQDPHWAVKKT